jgi:hypothetical protein
MFYPKIICDASNMIKLNLLCRCFGFEVQKFKSTFQIQKLSKRSSYFWI